MFVVAVVLAEARMPRQSYPRPLNVAKAIAAAKTTSLRSPFFTSFPLSPFFLFPLSSVLWVDRINESGCFGRRNNHKTGCDGRTNQTIAIGLCGGGAALSIPLSMGKAKQVKETRDGAWGGAIPEHNTSLVVFQKITNTATSTDYQSIIRHQYVAGRNRL